MMALTKAVSADASAIGFVLDTLPQRTLRTVEVKGQKVTSFIEGNSNGASVVSMELMKYMPRILGNADPLRYVQQLPGVQSNSELDAGLHVHGCDNQHNHVGIDGVTIYNAAHLLGLFSVFNPTHFQSMRLEKTAKMAASPNRIGGVLSMETPDSLQCSGMHGSVTVGPMSSQGTINVPVGEKSALTLSGRKAYLNLIYGPWLKLDDNQMGYDFDDYNLTWLYIADTASSIKMNVYYGHDNVSFLDEKDNSIGRSTWRNAMASLQWRRYKMQQNLYVTHYDNNVSYDSGNLHVGLPSSITDVGYSISSRIAKSDVGMEVIWHSIKPQAPSAEGLYRFRYIPAIDNSFEASAYFDTERQIAPSFALHAALRSSLYSTKRQWYGAVDPGLTLSWNSHTTTLSLHSGIRHQYLFRTGFSDAGLPTEFWFGCGGGNRPQYALNSSLQFTKYLFNRQYRIETEMYYQHLYHQMEYDGNIYNLFYSEFSLESSLLKGRGRNYGVSMMLEKRKGVITGWMSYSYGRALRHFNSPRFKHWYPAKHERVHELNAVATYRIGKSWNVGATLLFASGTPYTSLMNFYLVNNNLITEFGEYNDSRLNNYFRIDCSIDYDITNKNGRRSGINFSLYNVTMHRNNLFHRIKIYNGHYASVPFHLAIPILPSLNYYYEF